MLTYLLRRILLMIPTLLGITVVVFAVMALSPGGISPQSLIEGNMKPNEKQALMDYYNKRYGLNDPAPLQYVGLIMFHPLVLPMMPIISWKGFPSLRASILGKAFNMGVRSLRCWVNAFPLHYY